MAARGRKSPSASRLSHVVIELASGTVLLGGAALAGALFVRRPWPNRLDVAGYAFLPQNSNSVLYHRIADLGSLPVLLVGIAIAICLSVWRDLPRAAACAIGPVSAVLITEHIAKPLVARLITGGGDSYPSGTVTAAAALMTVATLAVPKLLRPFVALAGTGVVVAVSAAVIAMRWHYPTDTVGGILVGVGAVLLFDAAFHLPGAIRRDLRLRRGQRPARTPTRRGALQRA